MTIGQLAPMPSGVETNSDYIASDVSSGPSYVVPQNGTITSWSINASSTANQMATLKVYRNVGAPIYQVVGLDGPHMLNTGLVNPFVVNIPVQAGDVLGCTGTGAGATCLFTGGPGDNYRVLPPV